MYQLDLFKPTQTATIKFCSPTVGYVVKFFDGVDRFPYASTYVNTLEEAFVEAYDTVDPACVEWI